MTKAVYLCTGRQDSQEKLDEFFKEHPEVLHDNPLALKDES